MGVIRCNSVATVSHYILVSELIFRCDAVHDPIDCFILLSSFIPLSSL
jgi:hypothetical protein